MKADTLLLSLCETLLGQADTLDALASLLPREKRAPLLERAASHRDHAAALFSEAVQIDGSAA